MTRVLVVPRVKVGARGFHLDLSCARLAGGAIGGLVRGARP